MSEDAFFVACPHCNSRFELERSAINCGIFRHGWVKMEPNGVFVPIPPHSSKQVIDDWTEKGLVSGCGRPFRIVNGTQIEPCDYV